MKLPQCTVEARPCPTGVNVLKTLVQTALFWGFFLGVLPWGVLSAERALGASRGRDRTTLHEVSTMLAAARPAP